MMEVPIMIKAVIFDWGGVLESDTRETFTNWLIEKTNLGREAIRRIDGYYYREMNLGHITLERVFDRYTYLFNLDMPFDEFKKIFFQEFRINKNLLRIINEKLVGKYRLYVLSNNNDYIANKARNMQEFKFFDNMFFSCEMGIIKPDTEFFKKVLSAIKMSAQDCLFIDNSQGNAYIAEKLGMKAIVFQDCKQFNDSLNELIKSVS